jgi:uncharacterized protein (TIGR03382 family)
MLLLWMFSAFATESWFYPSKGEQTLTVVGDHLGGVEVKRTGRVVARAQDPQAIEARPDVARVQVLSGDGQVFRAWPAPGVDTFALSRDLHDLPEVEWAHPDLSTKLMRQNLPEDPYYPDQWYLQNSGQNGWTPGVDIHVEDAWLWTDGSGILVAVLDTGVDITHPDLNVYPGYDYVQEDDDQTPDPEEDPDGYPHGTASAGLIAARGNNGIGIAGVAHGADLYAIRMLGGYVSNSQIYEAVVEAVDAGAAVVSNSWGIVNDCEPYPLVAVLEDALNYAEDEGRDGLGTAFVQSAGNSSCDFSSNEMSAHKSVISVGAISGNDQLEWYSSYGSLLDISAPSGNILTTDMVGEAGYGNWHGDLNYWGDYSGTSASAPIVSGVLALMFASNPRLTVKKARKALCATAVRMDPEGGDYDEEGFSDLYGCGRVDAGAAVAAVADLGAPTWTADPVILAPLMEAPVHRVMLLWEPAVDPDGRAISYTLTYWPEAHPYDTTKVEDLTEPWLDLTGAFEVGDNFGFRVEAHDPWGKGESSGDAFAAIVPEPVPPEEPAMVEVVQRSCSSTSGPPFLWSWVGLVWMWLWSRRRA